MGFRRGVQIAAAAMLVTMLASLAQLGAQQPWDLKALARQSLAKIDGDLNVSGLKEPVKSSAIVGAFRISTARNVDDLLRAGLRHRAGSTVAASNGGGGSAKAGCPRFWTGAFERSSGASPDTVGRSTTPSGRAITRKASAFSPRLRQA